MLQIGFYFTGVGFWWPPPLSLSLSLSINPQCPVNPFFFIFCQLICQTQNGGIRGCNPFIEMSQNRSFKHLQPSKYAKSPVNYILCTVFYFYSQSVLPARNKSIMKPGKRQKSTQTHPSNFTRLQFFAELVSTRSDNFNFS